MDRTERTRLAGRLREVISRKQVSEMVSMSHYTTLHIGGPAELFVEIAGEEQLRAVLAIAEEEKKPVTILGRGSNLLVRDGGIRGICIYLGDEISAVTEAEPLDDGRFSISAQCGASLVKLCNAAADAGLSGLEFAGGIPGTVGGAIYMNAGAYGGEMKDCVTQVRLMHADGSTEIRSNAGMGFSYRHSALMDHPGESIVLSASFTLTPRDSETVHAAMREFNARRREKQPLNLPCCGSTFKRPEGQFAGTLISDCGLKGYRVGGCSVSELHAGFLVNDRNGTAADYETLIGNVSAIVFEKTGVKLEPEVRIIGEAELPEE